MRIIGIATLLAASAIGFSAVAADAPQTGQAPKAAPAARGEDLDHVVCKAEEATGSRLPTKKTCHTRREWNDIAEQSRKLLDDRTTHQNNPTAR